MKSTEPVQAKTTKQQVEEAAVFFRLFAQAQQALVQLMAAPEDNAAELAAFHDMLEKLQSNIAMYLGAAPEPEMEQSVEEPVEQPVESFEEQESPQPETLPEPSNTDPRIALIANRPLRTFLLTHPHITLPPHIDEPDIQLFNIFFESDRKKALTKDLGLQTLSAVQVAEITLGDEELRLIQQIKNKAIEELLTQAEGPAIWGLTAEQITQLNDSNDISEQRDILDALGMINIPETELIKIAQENARLQSLAALDSPLFNSLFSNYPDLHVQTDEEGNLPFEAQIAIQELVEMKTKPELDRDSFESQLDAIGIGHAWLDEPADLSGMNRAEPDSDQTWWYCFETEHRRVRGAYYFVDPTLRTLIINDAKYKVQEPIDNAALIILNQSKSTVFRGEYLSALRVLVPRLIINDEQFEQISAFLQALEYLKAAVSIDVMSKVDAAENTFNRVKNETITRTEQLNNIEQKIDLVQQALTGLEEFFADELTQDIVDITFSALDTVIDIRSVFPKDTLGKFFELRKNVKAYQQKLMLIREEGELSELPEQATTLPEPPAPAVENKPTLQIPNNIAVVIQLSKNAKWEGLLAQTENAVQQVAERFGWTGTPDNNNPELTTYSYANGLKITYSRNGISYYERNLDDAQISEDLQQKESELAYAWVELLRPSILVEPVMLAGQSKSVIGRLVSEFKARNIHTVVMDATSGKHTGDKGKGFFQNLTDAARRLDQFGRYLDKGR